MNRRSFLALGASVSALARPSRRPNIIFIMSDQQRYDSVGANGNKLVRTPNLDRLAKQSANFTHCFAQAPVCTPSRITWFTGRYPHSHRNRVNYTPLASDETLIQQRLMDAGYRTASIGKLHFWPPTVEHALGTGFHRVLLHDGIPPLDDQSDYVKWRRANDPDADVSRRAVIDNPASGENPFRAKIADRYHETTWVGEQTRKVIRAFADRDQPFFVFSSFFQPHSPFYVPAGFDSMYNDIEFPLPRRYTRAEIESLPRPLRALILRGRNPPYDMDRERLQWAYRSYHGAIAQLDREVGAILDTLEESGEAGNTIVVFSTDHGDQMLEHGLMGKNCFFEGSIRLPFMIRFPSKIKSGTYDQLVETTDLLPTLFELAGVEVPYNCQGRSFAPLLTGGDYAPRDAVFSENIIPEVITTGSLDFEFVRGEGIKGVRHPDAKMVRTSRWKLVRYGSGEGELYDLRHDPNEDHNLFGVASHRDIQNHLTWRILQWLITAGETDQIAPRWKLGLEDY